MIVRTALLAASIAVLPGSGETRTAVVQPGRAIDRTATAAVLRTIPATTVNHVAIDIDVSPDLVWRTIIDLYVSMAKARAQGRITQFDDPGYPLGSYRMRTERDGAVDVRLVHITERDEKARRLSLAADYLSVPGGLQVYATYQAQERPGGARFAIDCHTHASLEMPAAGPSALPGVLAAAKAHSDAFLLDFLKRVKARLETAGGKSSDG